MKLPEGSAPEWNNLTMDALFKSIIEQF